RHLARLLLELDDVVVLHPIGGDGDTTAIDLDVAVVHELARGEDGRRELGAIDDGIDAPLQQGDQMLAGVALAARGLGEDAVELTLADVPVVALELLLGHQLETVFRWLLAPLAVLAGTVFPLVDRALGAAPQIDVEAAIDLVLRLLSLRHVESL